MRDTYVDGIQSGGDSAEARQKLKEETTIIMEEMGGGNKASQMGYSSNTPALESE